ncbi:MAG: hypothetical protein ACLR6J_00970 [Parabacteroides merdae]
MIESNVEPKGNKGESNRSDKCSMVEGTRTTAWYYLILKNL